MCGSLRDGNNVKVIGHFLGRMRNVIIDESFRKIDHNKFGSNFLPKETRVFSLTISTKEGVSSAGKEKLKENLSFSLHKD